MTDGESEAWNAKVAGRKNKRAENADLKAAIKENRKAKTNFVTGKGMTWGAVGLQRKFAASPEHFSILAFLPLFEGQKVTFFPLSSGKNIMKSVSQGSSETDHLGIPKTVKIGNALTELKCTISEVLN